MKSNRHNMMNRYCMYVLIMLFSFFWDIEVGFSQVKNFKTGEIVTINIDSFPCFRQRIKQTNILYKLPSDFILCKHDSIGMGGFVFKYIPSFPNLRPDIIQSKDKQVLVLLSLLYLFNEHDSIKRQKNENINRMRICKQAYSDGIKIYPSKIAETYFNADSLFIWRLIPEKTDFLFVADTVNVANKLIERLDSGYNIKDELFWQYYPYCKTMIIKNKNIGYIPVYIYLTDKGAKHEEKYIRALKKLFWFQ